ncbi:MAG: hypothetical protein HC834_04595 [Rhodospirillales bacterium]|nr:hypothetical protein [Rhodospirillales bacterium]
MRRLRTTALDRELARRLAILARGEEVDRDLPKADTIALAAITIGSFAIVLIAQAL